LSPDTDESLAVRHRRQGLFAASWTRYVFYRHRSLLERR